MRARVTRDGGAVCWRERIESLARAVMHPIIWDYSARRAGGEALARRGDNMRLTTARSSVRFRIALKDGAVYSYRLPFHKR